MYVKPRQEMPPPLLYSLPMVSAALAPKKVRFEQQDPPPNDPSQGDTPASTLQTSTLPAAPQPSTSWAITPQIVLAYGSPLLTCKHKSV